VATRLRKRTIRHSNVELALPSQAVDTDELQMSFKVESSQMNSLCRSAASLGVLYFIGAAVSPALAQDAKSGANVFKRCAVCHSTDGSKRVGPSLRGVVGRMAGSVRGFQYSQALKLSSVTWDEKSLNAYLTNPQKFLPGNRMAFPGLPNPRTRADVIAYLKTLK
jgi:cytochrome c